MSDKKTRENIAIFHRDIEMPGGYRFNHAETLRTINLYYNGKYKTGKFDSSGYRKFFYNIVKPTVDIAEKFVDLDTKDIILVPEKAGDEMKVWLMQRRLKQWLKDKRFGELLNEIGHDFAKGWAIIKKADDRWQTVSPDNLRADPAAQRLEASDFVYEVHYMTKDQVMDSGWEDADLIKEAGSDDFKIYECYDKVGKKYTRTIKTDPFQKTDEGNRSANAEVNDESEFLPSIVLDVKENVKLPYRELRWEDVPGRLLPLGFIEYLEDNQIAHNEAENLERKGLVYKSLQIWQTRDESTGGLNALTGIDNGDILKITSEITPVQKDNSDLAAFNNTRERWNRNDERKTFTSDITTGQNLPSRTPLGVANLQAQLATSFFELKREKFGLFIKYLVLEDILPDFQNDNREEHTLTFLGSDDELRKLDKAIMRAKVDEAVEDYADRTGFFPSTIQLDDLQFRVEEQLNRSINRYVKVPKNFYRDANFVVDVLVTGESLDVSAQDSIMQFVMQLLIANPGALQNRTIRGMVFKIMGGRGISPAELDMLSEDVDTTVPLQPGGSASSPNPTQTLGASPTQV